MGHSHVPEGSQRINNSVGKPGQRHAETLESAYIYVSYVN
jgi:hypothetical protein